MLSSPWTIVFFAPKLYNTNSFYATDITTYMNNKYFEEIDYNQPYYYETKKEPCPGCTKNNPYLHTGTYCKIKDWKANKTVKFVSLLKNRMVK